MVGVSEALLSAAKNYLDITWSEAGGDAKLTDILRRGMRYMEQAAGTPLDFDTADKPQELLFEYARYVRNNALQYFAQDFQGELRMLQWRANYGA